MGCSNCIKKDVIVVNRRIFPMMIQSPVELIRKSEKSSSHPQSEKLCGMDSKKKSQLICRSTVSLSASSESEDVSDSLKDTGDIIKRTQLDIETQLLHQEKSKTQSFPIRCSNVAKRISTISEFSLDKRSEMINLYFFGANSGQVATIMFKLLTDNELIVNCNDQECSRRRGDTGSKVCFKSSSNGHTLLNKLRKAPRLSRSDNLCCNQRLNSIIAKLVCDEIHVSSNGKSKSNNSVGTLSINNFHVSLGIDEQIESIDWADSQFLDRNSVNILVLTFDYYDRKGFDYITKSINELKRGNSESRILSIGSKTISGILNEVDPEKMYEVNEDFARIAFLNLGINYATIIQFKNDNSRLGNRFALSNGTDNNVNDDFSLDEKLFDFLFNL